MQLKILDNVLPAEVFDRCVYEAENSSSYKALYGAGDGQFGFKYNWTFNTVEEGEEITNKAFADLWVEVKKHLPENIRLHRGYVNAHSYGVEDCIHIDETDIYEGLTVIVYLCHAWYPEWFGQTCFYQSTNKVSNEIVKSVLPKYNRMVIFDKNVAHSVSPLSRRFAGLRLSAMYKVELT
jgi:hypothetical protein